MVKFSIGKYKKIQNLSISISTPVIIAIFNWHYLGNKIVDIFVFLIKLITYNFH